MRRQNSLIRYYFVIYRTQIHFFTTQYMGEMYRIWTNFKYEIYQPVVVLDLIIIIIIAYP